MKELLQIITLVSADTTQPVSGFWDEDSHRNLAINFMLYFHFFHENKSLGFDYKSDILRNEASKTGNTFTQNSNYKVLLVLDYL